MIGAEKIFVAKNSLSDFNFFNLKDHSGYPLGSHFLERTILHAALTIS